MVDEILDSLGMTHEGPDLSDAQKEYFGNRIKENNTAVTIAEQLVVMAVRLHRASAVAGCRTLCALASIAVGVNRVEAILRSVGMPSQKAKQLARQAQRPGPATASGMASPTTGGVGFKKKR